MTLKVSICIPTYNRACFLEQALESILNNQITDYFEVIISDNNSTDSTETVVKRFKNELNIVYKKNLRNIGAVRNLIKATEFSNGEYVWLWGDDDVMIEGAADYLREFLINYPDVGYIYYPRVLTDKELNPIPNGVQLSGYKGNIFFENGNALLAGLDGQMPGLIGFFSSTVIRRTHWDGAKKALEGMSVEEFHYLRILLKAILEIKCAVLEKQGVYCRLNYRGFSHNSKVWFDQYIETFQFAKDMGYSESMCNETIQELIRSEITVNRRMSHVKLCIADEPCRGYFDTKKASFNFSRPAILIPF